VDVVNTKDLFNILPEQTMLLLLANYIVNSSEFILRAGDDVSKILDEVAEIKGHERVYALETTNTDSLFDILDAVTITSSESENDKSDSEPEPGSDSSDRRHIAPLSEEDQQLHLHLLRERLQKVQDDATWDILVQTERFLNILFTGTSTQLLNTDIGRVPIVSDEDVDAISDIIQSNNFQEVVYGIFRTIVREIEPNAVRLGNIYSRYLKWIGINATELYLTVDTTVAVHNAFIPLLIGLLVRRNVFDDRTAELSEPAPSVQLKEKITNLISETELLSSMRGQFSLGNKVAYWRIRVTMYVEMRLAYKLLMDFNTGAGNPVGMLQSYFGDDVILTGHSQEIKTLCRDNVTLFVKQYRLPRILFSTTVQEVVDLVFSVNSYTIQNPNGVGNVVIMNLVNPSQYYNSILHIWPLVSPQIDIIFTTTINALRPELERCLSTLVHIN
jgi:hypothetical protein